jgi:cytochrome P450
MSSGSTPTADPPTEDPPTHTAEPPSYDGLPVIGNTHQMVREQGGFYEAAAELGDVVHLRLLGIGDLYQVSDPGLVREVLVTEQTRYGKASISKDQLGELVGEGLVLSEGELWQRQRQRIQPAFYRNRIATYADTMASEAAAVADEWSDGDVVNIEDELKALTLRILVKAMFGTEIDYEDRGIRDTVQDLQRPGHPSKQPIAQTIPKWVPIPMWRRYKEGIDDIEDLISEFVAVRREQDDLGDDLLSRLLAGSDDDGEGMSEKLVRDELITFLFAGHETTATALTFAWFSLAQDPDVEERLAAELTSELDDTPTFEDLSRLDYTEAVLLESMRLYPPVPAIPREPDEDTTLGGYEIPAGGTVSCSQWAIHRDEQWWEDPYEFRPERWLADDGTVGADGDFSSDGDSDDGKATLGRVSGEHARGDRPRFAYFPFGGGPRRCVGEQFALVEGKLLLATLLRRYSPTLESDPDIDLSVSITTRPVDPVEIGLSER